MIRQLFSITARIVVVTLLFASLPVTVSAANSRLNRISQAWDGSQADGGSYSPAISADGRFVVYHSLATNLVKGGQPSQLYLFDRQAGATELVSVASDGSPANSEANHPAISADGRYIAFGSNATNLAGESSGEIYLRDRVSGKTLMVSGPVDGSPARGDASFPAISGDGRYVAFLSFADNLDPRDEDILPDIFVRDMQKNTLTLVSVSSSGEKANSDSGVAGGLAISSDGRYVAFQSYASNLVPDDTNEASDIFVRDLVAGKTERVSVSSSGEQANDRSGSLAISGDGRFVSFISWASNLVAGDTNGAPDIFVHDRVSGKTERINMGVRNSMTISGVIYDTENYAQLSLSHDGRYLAFASQATSPVKRSGITTCDFSTMGGGVEPCANAFLYDRQSGKLTLLSASAKNQTGSAASYNTAISQDGHWVAFASEASNLTPGDTNQQADIYLYHH